MHKIPVQDLMTYIEEAKETPVVITEDGWDRYALIDMHDYDLLMEAKALLSSATAIDIDVLLDGPMSGPEDYQEMCERYLDLFHKLFGPDTEKMN